MPTNNKVIHNIIDNYIRNEKSIVNQLHFATDHGPTIGGFREDIWKEMFQQIIPGKFAIEQSVFIIDSTGAVSKEVDLAIFDETYTPYIFHYGRLKFLPIEAVAVVIECKSNSLKKENLKCWVESIVDLKTSNQSYARMATAIVKGEETKGKPTQTSTRPLRILCKLAKDKVDYKAEKGVPLFDIVITASKKEKQLIIEYSDGKKDLRDWYKQLNHVNLTKGKEIYNGKELEGVLLTDYQVIQKDKEITLLSFNFQLNQLLMLINNPILFPHMAYAKLFCKDVEGGEETDE